LSMTRSASEQNLSFLRDADVIMTLAEAAKEMGNTADAVGHLHRIRQRANVDLVDATSVKQTQRRKLIQEERAREFVGEFQRKWDLSRWGNLVDAVQRIEDDNAEGARNVQAHHALFPIPYDEIVKNRNLTQNTGYN